MTQLPPYTAHKLASAGHPRFRVSPTDAVDKNVKDVIDIMAEYPPGGITHDEALAILEQRRAGSVIAEEDATGGDPLVAGKTTVTLESEEAAVRDRLKKQSTAAAAGGQQALPQVPEPAGGQRNMRLLELIGNLGSEFSKNRAIGKADKATAQRQAYANLINTLRGSPTASVSPATPKEGILGTLARGVGGTGKALRESREAEAAGKADRFGQEMDVRKQRASEEEAAATRAETAGSVKVDIRTVQGPGGDEVLKTVTDAKG